MINIIYHKNHFKILSILPQLTALLNSYFDYHNTAASDQLILFLFFFF